MIRAGFILFLFIFPFKGNTQEFSQAFETGNKLYREGKYKEAVQSYHQALRNDFSSARIYYNLGNSWYRLNDILNAILHYEKALKIDPSLEDAVLNLRIANQQITDKVQPIPEFFLVTWWKQIIRAKSPDAWAWLSLQVLLLSLLAFGLFRISGNDILKRAGLWGGSTMMLLFLLMTIFAFIQKKHYSGENHAIVFSPVVNAFSAPGTSGAKLFVIHEGLKVEISGESDEWREIRLANGEKGWVKAAELEVI